MANAAPDDPVAARPLRVRRRSTARVATSPEDRAWPPARCRAWFRTTWPNIPATTAPSASAAHSGA